MNKTDLRRANLNYADLTGANLSGANLSHADCNNADLGKTDLSWTDFSYTNLTGAQLGNALLYRSKLVQANLYESILFGTTIIGAGLDGANLDRATFGNTIIVDCDLSTVNNLHSVYHIGFSSIAIDVLYKSRGNIPPEFLEDCGVPETMITFAKSLVGSAIEYYSCFISYSTKNEDFAQHLNDRMKREGLRVWFAPEEMKGGKKIHEQIYDAIRYHDKLILVLSEASMSSPWVETEIKNAKEQERETKRRKLFPISLVPFEEIKNWKLFDADDGRDLAREIREFYIPDFSNWKDYDSFNREFEKLLKALRAE